MLTHVKTWRVIFSHDKIKFKKKERVGEAILKPDHKTDMGEVLRFWKIKMAPNKVKNIPEALKIEFHLRKRQKKLQQYVP